MPRLWSVTVRADKQTAVIHTICLCGDRRDVTVEYAAWVAYLAGDHAQVAFAELSADTRERIISGTCKACWDRMADELEEEDE